MSGGGPQTPIDAPLQGLYMSSEDLAGRILAIVLDPKYRPSKPKAVAELLGVREEERYEFRSVVKKLVRDGKLAFGVNHMLFPPHAAPSAKGGGGTGAVDEVIGRMRRSSSGHGFVRPRGAGAAHRREDDIHVPDRFCGDAATGDLVLIRIVRAKPGGRSSLEGKLVKVLERQSHAFVGTYLEQRSRGYVKVDGQVFAQPVYVGDPGAKNVQIDDKVVVEMVRFPTHALEGEGVITEILGPRGRPGVDTLTILREYDLSETFPEEVLEQARLEARAWEEATAEGEPLPAGRMDLSGDTVITIDPATARDFDDAISLVVLENGHWKLGVHIADVSHFVREGTPLDDDAKARGTSVYLPDRVVPMLPELISNGLASLQPGQVRYTLSAFIEFTAEGAFVGVDLARGAIRSAHRFNYEEVDEFLAGPEAFRERCSPAVHDLLGRMRDLARLLRGRRKERGSLEMNMPEIEIDLDKSGGVKGAHAASNTESHHIIEEFMLAANEAVAETLYRKGRIFLRRVHAAPDPRKLKNLTEFAKGLGFDVEDLSSRFELQKLLDESADMPQRFAVHYAVLRSMQRAVYSPEESGHYALASRCYCHFTSPIRRYPDLTVHRLVHALIDGRAPEQDPVQIAVLGEHCSLREQIAEEAERELKKIKLLNFLAGQLGLELPGMVTGVEDFGIFVQGIELPADGLVHVTSLPDDFYDFDRVGHKLVGRRTGRSFCLGDQVKVVVAHVDVDARVLDFKLVQGPQRAPRPGGSTRTGAKKFQKKLQIGPAPKSKTRPPKGSKGKGKKKKKR